ncbi:MAG: Nif3-like dinuclear metal center hexameric protein [Candidatus Sumerlaeaceae bacterium]
MPLTLAKLTAAIDDFAPFRLAYEWDNVGLQIGNPAAQIERLVVALELNDRVLGFAIAQKAEAILTHHPLIFKPQRNVTTDTLAGRLQMELIQSSIALIAAHTNLDRVLRGTNGAVAALLGLQDPIILEPATVDELYKFTVFVPRDYTPKLIEAIHRGGGGRIGQYSHCTFRAPGTGTYVPQHGANPFVGREGKFEQVEEDRIETLVPRRALRSLLHEVRQAHPYEQVAYDIFPLHDADPKYGLGAVGILPSKTTLRQFANNVRNQIGAEFVTFAGDPGSTVKRVSVCTGSAGGCSALVTPAVADVLVTGELTYHLTLDALQRGISVVAVGHAASERVFAPYFCKQFGSELIIAESALQLIPYTDFPEPWLLSLPRQDTAEAETPAPSPKPRKQTRRK